jgi:hypothetical protein
MTPQALADLILALTAPELLELNDILRGAGGEEVGVREPRRPRPSGDAAEDHAIPADYWESAE